MEITFTTPVSTKRKQKSSLFDNESTKIRTNFQNELFNESYDDSSVFMSATKKFKLESRLVVGQSGTSLTFIADMASTSTPNRKNQEPITSTPNVSSHDPLKFHPTHTIRNKQKKRGKSFKEKCQEDIRNR